MKSLLILFSLPLFVLNIQAQQNSIVGDYKITGSLKTEKGEVLQGAYLYVRKSDANRTFATDVNGEFRMDLQPGDYEITVNGVNSADFKAFIKIQDGGLNPDNVDFVIEPSRVCCTTPSGAPYPKPNSLLKPTYPAAARAVRAWGEVVVKTVIDRQGKVISATATSGHPLLRGAATSAAKAAGFEPSETETERELLLTFAFLFFQKERAGVVPYTNPYRIVLMAPEDILHID